MHIFIHSKNLHQAPISVFHQDPHVSGAVPALPAPTLTVLDVSKRCVSSSGTAVLRIGAQMAITNGGILYALDGVQILKWVYIVGFKLF